MGPRIADTVATLLTIMQEPSALAPDEVEALAKLTHALLTGNPPDWEQAYEDFLGAVDLL